METTTMEVKNMKISDFYNYKSKPVSKTDIEKSVEYKLTTNNFDPEKGSKAFTYFSVVSKNWFIAEVKKTSKKAKRETHLEEYFLTHSDQSNTPSIQQLVVHNTYIDDRNKYEFFLHLNKEIQSWKKMPLRENEVKTIQAIEILFSEANNIEIFNKKAIYLYMREITGLNTKQIVTNLNKMRAKYKVFRQKWDNGDIK